MNYITSIYHVTPTDPGHRVKFAASSNNNVCVAEKLTRVQIKLLISCYLGRIKILQGEEKA